MGFLIPLSILQIHSSRESPKDCKKRLDNNEVDQTRKQSITELSKDRLSKIANARLYIKKNRQKLKNINKKKIPVITITDELATLLSLSFKKQKEERE